MALLERGSYISSIPFIANENCKSPWEMLQFPKGACEQQWRRPDCANAIFFILRKNDGFLRAFITLASLCS